MSNVIELGRIKCPAGSRALHAVYGFCDVLQVDGRRRLVSYEVHVPDDIPDTTDLPDGILAEEVLFSEKIHVEEAWVDLSELREANPSRDLRSPCGGIRGQVVRFVKKRSSS